MCVWQFLDFLREHFVGGSIRPPKCSLKKVMLSNAVAELFKELHKFSRLALQSPIPNPKTIRSARLWVEDVKGIIVGKVVT